MEPALNIYFDIQMAMLLTVLAAGVFFVERDRRHNRASFTPRKQALAKIFVVLCTMGFIGVIYGGFIEPRVIRIVRAEAELGGGRRLQTPIKVALISDLHLGPYKRDGFVRRAAGELLRLKPDVVVLAGDLVEDATRTGEARHLLPFSAVTREIPVVAVLGNHDSGLGDELDYLPLPDHEYEVRSVLREAGITVLDNKSLILDIHGEAVAFVGLADIRTGRTDPGAALSAIPDDILRIVLAHNPDVVRLLDPRRADLLLAGHTHGGQIRLPFWGSLSRITTTFGQRVDRGLFTIGGLPVFITSGIGESGTRARLFVPPEIALLTIQ